MKIISLNIEYAKSTTPADTACAFRPLRPDVVLFNEVPSGDWTSRVGEELGLGHAYCGMVSSANHVDKYKSILSRTPLSETREILVEGIGWNPISVVRAKTTIEETTIALYALHIPGRPEREGSACDFLAGTIMRDELCENVIAGGDYNNLQADEPLTAMRDAGFRSIWSDLGVDTSQLFTYDAMNPERRAGVIDHFFLRSGSDLHIIDGGVVELARPLADHKPIWIELS